MNIVSFFSIGSVGVIVFVAAIVATTAVVVPMAVGVVPVADNAVVEWLPLVMLRFMGVEHRPLLKCLCIGAII